MLESNTKYVFNIKQFLDENFYGVQLSNFLQANALTLPVIIDNPELLRSKINDFDSDLKMLYKVFFLGESVEKLKFVQSFGQNITNALQLVGLIDIDSNYLSTCNYMIFYYHGFYFVVDLPFTYQTCKNKKTNTYIGTDSFYLAENHIKDKRIYTLDLCCGSGIQSILASDESNYVTGVEINPEAASVAKFNVLLNNLEDKVTIVEADIFTITDSQKYDLIYANPPFVPIDDSLNFSIIGHGGYNGFKIIKEIIKIADRILNEGGRLITIGECLGNKDRAYIEDYINRLHIQSLSFEILLFHRIPSEIASYRLARIISILENYEFNEVKNKITDSYKSQGGEYYYIYILRCVKKLKAQPLRISRTHSKWTIEDIPKICSNYFITRNSNTYKLSIGTRKPFVINELQKNLIELCDGSHSLEMIIDLLSNDIDFEENTLELINFCSYLEQRDLIYKK